VTVTGTVVDLQFMNPHSINFFDVTYMTRSGSLSRRGPAVVCYFVRRLPEGVVR